MSGKMTRIPEEYSRALRKALHNYRTHKVNEMQYDRSKIRLELSIDCLGLHDKQRFIRLTEGRIAADKRKQLGDKMTRTGKKNKEKVIHEVSKSEV